MQRRDPVAEVTTSRRIVVTGGAGFIGTHLCRSLRADGHSVVVLDSRLSQVHGDLSSGEAADGIVRADVRDADAVGQVMDGAEVVYHLAAETGVGQSQYEIARYVGTNTLGTAVVLQAAVAAKVAQVILTSSRAVYGEGSHRCPACDRSFSGHGRRTVDMDKAIWELRCPRCGGAAHPMPMTESDASAPTSIYGITKLQQEELATAVGATYGIPVTILRLFNVFGPGQSLRNPYVGVLGTFFRQALSGGSIELYEDGHMGRDFVFIDDVVGALHSSMANETVYGLTINVGSGVPVRLIDVAAHLFDYLDKTPEIVVSGRYRVGDVRHAVADTTLLTATLGSARPTDIVDGLAAYAAWARANPAGAADDAAEAQLTSRQLLRGGGR